MMISLNFGRSMIGFFAKGYEDLGYVDAIWSAYDVAENSGFVCSRVRTGVLAIDMYVSLLIRTVNVVACEVILKPVEILLQGEIRNVGSQFTKGLSLVANCIKRLVALPFFFLGAFVYPTGVYKYMHDVNQIIKPEELPPKEEERPEPISQNTEGHYQKLLLKFVKKLAFPAVINGVRSFQFIRYPHTRLEIVEGYPLRQEFSLPELTEKLEGEELWDKLRKTEYIKTVPFLVDQENSYKWQFYVKGEDLCPVATGLGGIPNGMIKGKNLLYERIYIRRMNDTYQVRFSQDRDGLEVTEKFVTSENPKLVDSPRNTDHAWYVWEEVDLVLCKEEIGGKWNDWKDLSSPEHSEEHRELIEKYLNSRKLAEKAAIYRSKL